MISQISFVTQSKKDQRRSFVFKIFLGGFVLFHNLLQQIHISRKGLAAFHKINGEQVVSGRRFC